MKTIEAARGKWSSILNQLGIDHVYLQDRHGPCPLCEGKDRFRFDNKNGDGTYYCNHCGAGNGMTLAMGWTGLDFKSAAKRIDELVGNITTVDKPQIQKKDPRIRLRKIAEAAKSIEGINPVSLYLKNRGLTAAIKNVKFHPGLDYYERDGKSIKKIGTYPAMVALIQNREKVPVSYHVTYLSDAGNKAPILNVKKILTPLESLDGSAIRLMDGSGDEIGVAEGIETAIAAYQIHGVPCWSCCSSNVLEKFEPMPHHKKVWIFGDNDASYEGHRAAYSLAKRLKTKGLEVEVRFPQETGSDFADELKRA